MTEPEEKTNQEEAQDNPNMDEIVTETYDKSLHLSHGAPTLDPPGVSTPSIYDKPAKEKETK